MTLDTILKEEVRAYQNANLVPQELINQKRGNPVVVGVMQGLGQEKAQ